MAACIASCSEVGVKISFSVVKLQKLNLILIPLKWLIFYNLVVSFGVILSWLSLQLFSWPSPLFLSSSAFFLVSSFLFLPSLSFSFPLFLIILHSPLHLLTPEIQSPLYLWYTVLLKEEPHCTRYFEIVLVEGTVDDLGCELLTIVSQWWEETPAMELLVNMDHSGIETSLVVSWNRLCGDMGTLVWKVWHRWSHKKHHHLHCHVHHRTHRKTETYWLKCWVVKVQQEEHLRNNHLKFLSLLSG